jgi:tetratricopeptide (TPR) repeat protein
MISTLASGQSGYNYYKRADRVGSKNEKAFSYFKKAYYDHIWNWTKTGSDSAVYYLQLAIKEDSLYGAAYAFLGHVYKFKTYDARDKDEFKNQKWYAEKAIRLNPKLGDAYTLMATVKWTEGDTASALKYLRQAVKIEPDHVGNYIWLGMRLSTIRQKKDSAIYYFHKIMKMDPEYGQAYMKLAVLYDDYKVYDSALFYFNKAIEHYENVRPRDLRMINGYLYSAYILKNNLKKYDLAENYLKTFIREVTGTDFMVKEQSLMNAYAALADCYQKMSERETQKLIEFNENFVKENPKDFDRIFQTIDSYSTLNNDSINLKYVLPLAKRLTDLAPNEEYRKFSLFLQVDILDKTKNLQGAINLLNDMNKKYPKDHLVLFETGRLYAKKGDDKKAMTFLNESNELIKTDTEREIFRNILKEKEFDRLRENKDFKKLLR